MATKQCPNGHQYDSSIYGDNCPFCPNSTRISNSGAFDGGATQQFNPASMGYNAPAEPEAPTQAAWDAPAAQPEWNGEMPPALPNMPMAGPAPEIEEKPTVAMQPGAAGAPASDGAHTVIRAVGKPVAAPSAPFTPQQQQSQATGGKIIGLLISYDHNPCGEVFHVYEGRNLVGRAQESNIVVNDNKMSGTHFLILYVEAEGVVWIEDQKSSNGTYVNGRFTRGLTELNNNDVINAGQTKFIFLRIPQF